MLLEQVLIDNNGSLPDLAMVMVNFEEGKKISHEFNYVFDDDISDLDRKFYMNHIRINDSLPRNLRQYRYIGCSNPQNFRNWMNGDSNFCNLYTGGSGMSNWWLYTHVKEDGSRTYWKGYNSIKNTRDGIIRHKFVYVKVTRRDVEKEFRYYMNLDEIIYDTADPDSYDVTIHVTNSMVNDVILTYTEEEYNDFINSPFIDMPF